MLKIIYGKKGHPLPDHQVFDWVEYNIQSSENITYTKVIETSNENVLTAFAMYALAGKIDVSDIEFYFEDEKLEFDPILGLQNPKGKQMGIYQEIMDKSLKYSYERMKKTRENKSF